MKGSEGVAIGGASIPRVFASGRQTTDPPHTTFNKVNMKHWSESLKELNACADVVDYCKDFPSLESAWSVCERGDWMLWYADTTRLHRLATNLLTRL